MNTATLHTQVQRSRFAQHALALLTNAFLKPAVRNPARSAAAEAQSVRDMAQAYVKTDPGFAADLYAAAARHEGQRADW